MKTSPAGIDLIKRSEGLRLQPYNDVAGVATIGYGHKIVPPATFEHGITEATALLMLADDIETAESAVESHVKVALSQGQFDALVDFVFNLGSGRLAESTLLKALNLGNYAQAATELLRWDIAGGMVNAALLARRRAEYALWVGEQVAYTPTSQEATPNA